ncbi:lytic polysaccharide monooxygenase [Streptomyces lonarensis]|uniref:lytic polysaccharide monooxygenase auxiliary activity family 9 protein n=1 Tax=Streptomyces lonarensis TaxID=700599 RepID=UPI0030C6BFB2
MTVRRTATLVGALAVAPLAAGFLAAAPAAAHGSMEDPVSRVRACFHEGPESPSSAACTDLVGIGGTQPLYDWNEVNIADANGRHRDIIPDGELCSAGRDKYAGLDQARGDWQASPMSAGNHTFRYTATAPHTGSFALYVTQQGYDPAAPLRWSDLEHFGEVTDPELRDGQYVFDMQVPERQGRHLIYSVWQRSDSPEAFYTCSDVVFGGGDGATSPGTGTGEPEPVDHSGHGDHADHGDHTAGKDGKGSKDEGDHTDAGDHGSHDNHIDSDTEAPAASEDETREETAAEDEPAAEEESAPVNEPQVNGDAEAVSLAATGGGDSAWPLAAGGAAVAATGLALVVFGAARRNAAKRGA